MKYYLGKDSVINTIIARWYIGQSRWTWWKWGYLKAILQCEECGEVTQIDFIEDSSLKRLSSMNTYMHLGAEDAKEELGKYAKMD